MMDCVGEAKVWRGQTMDDRSAERRTQLLAVGATILGDEGASAVTMRGVCRAASLSPRYFYESFGSREELLVAIYDDVERRLLERLTATPAGRGGQSVRQALQTCAEYFEEDPRRARILLREPLADDTLRAHQAGKSPIFIGTVLPALDQAAKRQSPRDHTELAVLAAALSGAIISLYLEWLDGRLGIDRNTLADTAARMVTAIARASRRA